MDAVLSVMVEDQLGPGAISQQLVKELGTYLGLESGAAFREYGRAINSAFDCLELKKGSKVIISPLAPAVYLDVILQREYEPLFADIDQETGGLALENVEKLIPMQPAVIIVHETLGFIPDIEALLDLQLPIIEDISQSIGGNVGEKKCGSFGNYVVLSMEPENIVTCGGGTIIFAGGRKEAAALKKMISIYPKESYLQDMNAALGIVQMKSIETFIEKRKEVAQVYSRALMRTGHKTLIQKGEAENIFFTFSVILSSGLKEVRQYARKHNVDTALAFEDSIIGHFEITDQDCSNAQSLSLRCLLFPLYPTIGKKNVSQVEKVLSTLP